MWNDDKGKPNVFYFAQRQYQSHSKSPSLAWTVLKNFNKVQLREIAQLWEVLYYALSHLYQFARQATYKFLGQNESMKFIFSQIHSFRWIHQTCLASPRTGSEVG